jgi:Holliday junction resolvasome RuvABC endonuclease subunit
MLRMPYDSGSIISIVGIDPGSTTLGTGTIWVDLTTMRIVASQAVTFHGDRLYRESWTGGLYGDRIARIWALENSLVHLFQQTQPFLIASEAPFINPRFPQAGLALTEVVMMIRNAINRYDPWKAPLMIDPPTVKNAVGAPGNADKDRVKLALMQLPDLCYNGAVPLQNLDEHSVDALAVAYCRWRTYLGEMNYG